MLGRMFRKPESVSPMETHALAAAPDRPILPAVLRGWRRCCPNCGAGPMLRGYLSVRDTCPACGEDLHHHRADDGPAYLTILVVGHIVIPAILWVFIAFRPDPLIMLAGFSVLTVALTLWLLPRIKGAFIALQWSRRMHGFGPMGAAEAGHDA